MKKQDRRIQSDQKTLPDKSGNPETHEKQPEEFDSSSTNVHIVGEDLLREFYKLFYLSFCVSSDQQKQPL